MNYKIRKGILKRFDLWVIRQSKKSYFLMRWDKACVRCWMILKTGDASVERFWRFTRNHRRLMRLIEKECPSDKPTS